MKTDSVGLFLQTRSVSNALALTWQQLKINGAEGGSWKRCLAVDPPTA